MNWQAKVILLILASASLFTFSCDKPKDIGLDLVDNLGTSFTDTLTLKTSALLLDSIKTKDPVSMIVGQIVDPKFGTVTATTYTQVGLNSKNVGDLIGANAVCDSVKFTLVRTYSYGDTVSETAINIYELAEELFVDTDYYNSDEIALGPLIESATFKSSSLSTTGDSLVIEMPKSFGQKILDLPTDKLNDQELFKAAFNGIALVHTGMVSAVYGFSNTSGVIEIFYKKEDNISRTQRFPVNILDTGFNGIKSDRAGTPVQTLVMTGDLIDTDGPPLNDQLYLQAGTGIRTLIKVPYLEEFKKSVGKIIINKAEMIIEPLDVSKDTPVPPAIILYESDENNRILQKNEADVFIPNELNGTNFTFAKDDKFVVPLTLYIDALIKGEKENNGIILSLTDNNARVSRLLAGDGDQDPGIRFRIYYTPVPAK